MTATGKRTRLSPAGKLTIVGRLVAAAGIMIQIAIAAGSVDARRAGPRAATPLASRADWQAR